MGGSDAFEPQELCKQIDALSGLQSKKDEELEDREKVDTENHIIWDDNLVLDDDKLQWNDQKEALCYFLFKLDENGKWKYQTNVLIALSTLPNTVQVIIAFVQPTNEEVLVQPPKQSIIH